MLSARRHHLCTRSAASGRSCAWRERPRIRPSISVLGAASRANASRANVTSRVMRTPCERGGRDRPVTPPLVIDSAHGASARASLALCLHSWARRCLQCRCLHCRRFHRRDVPAAVSSWWSSIVHRSRLCSVAVGATASMLPGASVWRCSMPSLPENVPATRERSKLVTWVSRHVC